MKRIIAIDHEGDNVPLDYETVEEAHRDLYDEKWLRVRGPGPMGTTGYLNPAAVYGIAEEQA